MNMWLLGLNITAVVICIISITQAKGIGEYLFTLVFLYLNSVFMVWGIKLMILGTI